MANGHYTYLNEDMGWKVETEVEATIVPYQPATYSEPADGGYLEDVTFTIREFKVKVADKLFKMPLDEELKTALNTIISNEYEADEEMRNDVYQSIK